jgi:8-oxo-dGTP pyrophosphatase MutT (NUDIX family)
MSAAAPAPAPKLAATILLVRDGASGLEVFMVQRHHKIDFATGAMVFPGGKIEASDADPRLRERCAGAAGLDADALAVRVGAIRETFEECGVLLARPFGSKPGSGRLVDAARLRTIEERHRERLNTDEIGLVDVVLAEDLELACDLLVPYAHWVTPEMVPKRFDTYFFLVAAPPDHVALHDGGESVDSVWTSAQNALAEAESGRRTIIFPTLMNLNLLGLANDVADALAQTRARPLVTVRPALRRTPDGKPELAIPPEAGYPPLPPTLAKLPAM